jgi:hypothetical protein
MNSEDSPFQPLLQTLRGPDFGESTCAVVPVVSIAEERTEPGEPIPGQGNDKEPCHQACRGPNRYAHQSRHICPHTHIEQAMPMRDTPPRQEISVCMGDTAKEWDFLERHRDLVFDNKGFSMHTPVAEKVAALAEDIWLFRREIQKPGGNTFSQCIPWSHPVDTLVYGSWCLGGAYALIALCATIGVQARHVSMWGHSAAEVHLGGRWRYVESIHRFGTGGNNLPDASFAEIILDPTNPDYGFSEAQSQVYWQTWAQQYTVHADGLWVQQKRAAVLCPQTVRALYPAWDEPRFKSDSEYCYELLPAVVGTTSQQFVLRRGQAMRRRFWLGSLASTRRLTAYFHGGRHGPWPERNVPADGGDWFVAVNDRIMPIRDNGGWDIQERPGALQGGWTHRVELPMDILRENAWNTVAIGCPGGGDEYICLTGYPPLEHPVEASFCPDTACL